MAAWIELERGIQGPQRRSVLKCMLRSPEKLAARTQGICMHHVQCQSLGDRGFSLREPAWIGIEHDSHLNTSLCEAAPSVGKIRIKAGCICQHLDRSLSIPLVYPRNAIRSSHVQLVGGIVFGGRSSRRDRLLSLGNKSLAYGVCDLVLQVE